MACLPLNSQAIYTVKPMRHQKKYLQEQDRLEQTQHAPLPPPCRLRASPLRALTTKITHALQPGGASGAPCSVRPPAVTTTYGHRDVAHAVE